MTQEELDSLMTQDTAPALEEIDTSVADDSRGQEDEIKAEFVDPDNYRPEADKKWPPPPPTEEHKVVHQLDDVTRDSEKKMSEVFDQIEFIGSSAMTIEKESKKMKEYLKSQEDMLVMLVKNFPNIKAFSESLEKTKQMTKVNDDIKNAAMDCNDACMQAMDIMQYQDIHRQKIERVINVMRALSQYMSSLFEGRVDDSKRVASATYIAGDDKDDLASDSDIESLIASFGGK